MDRSELFHKLYRQLRQLAHHRIAREHGGHDATSLVHEAYLKLRRWDASFQTDEHFLATTANVMRQILVDRARARSAQKREVKLEPLSISFSGEPAGKSNVLDVLILDQLLTRFAGLDPRAEQIAEMRLFLGLSDQDIAAALKISDRTVKRDWFAAKAWLRSQLGGS